IANVRTAHGNLLRLAASGLPLDLLATVCSQFAAAVPDLADPDMALNSLERFLLAARSPLAMAAFFERDPQALPNLLLILNSSQHLSDQLCSDPESYDLLRMTDGQPVAREVLVDELMSGVRSLSNEEDVLAALRQFKRRETLRIAYGDIVKELPVAQVARQISYVADAVVEAALDFATRVVKEKRPWAGGNEAHLPRFVVLALGKLGGLELNYSSDIDLVFLYQPKEESDVDRALAAQDFAVRVSQQLIRLLAEPTELGFAYRVDMRLRPEGRQGPICSSVEHAAAYYDNRGRTWERQAYVKARPIAGDLPLGRDYLKRLEPWVYRRYLSLADISGIKALKRRIEDRATGEGVSQSDVKTGHGGIRDIEFVIQFLQLLSGGAEPAVRTGNTLEAIVRLEKAGSLTSEESSYLEQNYSFLRKLEHRLQIMYDLQTHALPSGAKELGKLACRMGFVGTPHVSALEAFQADYQQRTEVNRTILDHLLHEAFGDDPENEPEVDLVNDPDPKPEVIERVLGRFPFEDTAAAYTNLMALAEERIPFLSTRRCRLFLASVAPRLLAEVAKTPDPDATLVTLSRVSDSLGGKAALWELLSSNHATLNLYVTLCAACPYLSGILTSNPGMIDDLLDSLLIAKLPDLTTLDSALQELVHGAEDSEPILHSFKHAQHLRVGVRDILGKDEIEATHAALSDIAEVCLRQILDDETARLTEKMGEPLVGDPFIGEGHEASAWHPGIERVGQPCEFVVLAMGKLGGREPNYHSDLDLVFLYEAEGSTSASARSASPRGGNRSTTNNHFFSELGQRIIKRANYFGPHGRLYEVDPRLRPTGRSGALAVSLEEFVRYFQSGSGQLWERQSLCKARVLTGSAQVVQRANRAITEATYCKPWKASFATEIRVMRLKLQESASRRNLKRNAGGTMDTEFVVQMLQLKHGLQTPEIRVTGTLAGLTALEQAGILATSDAGFLRNAYRFQRSVEARIRLMDSSGRHEFPEEPKDQAKLAFLLGYSDGQRLVSEVTQMFGDVRNTFLRIFEAAERDG
ncbi:MAG: bifunctional [glutamate--ammonia ligase]-adenylyl-L-tyrosine phosphorylase/[glutamate--ammonia-ligase] adenylyltransferase, partial [Planctomycetes bacterium]|nr:bifunctional [glutamate--ammonia ligase]-adenylyl-L-tyrosine phosphorylase/[glutamate--ammonia-ligase] adenylyltransferase [Planctomycetota bacterium]